MILHIINDYSGSSVYQNLISHLDGLGVSQIVYTPVKLKSNVGKNIVDLKSKSSRIIYSHILNRNTDRLFYRCKIRKIVKDIESKIDLSKVRFIHAHTWYSDGGVAYSLNKKYNIPFITAIRSTDLNIFYRFLVHQRLFGRNILKRANSVVLISASYKEKILNLPIMESIYQELISKVTVVPNGVDPFWINNLSVKSSLKMNDNTFNILYIGTFIKRKNLVLLQKAIIGLNNEINCKIKLHIVGGGGSESENVLKLVKDNPNLFELYGKVKAKEKLLEILRYCDVFALPSRNETFGLVYVESLLQGLPILYTEKQGIDGFYEDKIGVKVRLHTVQSIKNKLSEMFYSYDSYVIPTEKIVKNHDWSYIAKHYKSLYR